MFSILSYQYFLMVTFQYKHILLIEKEEIISLLAIQIEEPYENGKDLMSWQLKEKVTGVFYIEFDQDDSETSDEYVQHYWVFTQFR